jgi:hypothetical protein
MSLHILAFNVWGYYIFTHSRSLYLGRLLIKLHN